EQGREYDELGETAFLARKGEQFRAAVRADPRGFVTRVGDRVVAALLWYTPHRRTKPGESEYGIALARVLHPLPWVAVLVILLSAGRRAPSRGEWAVVVSAVLYILPYIIVSYTERYHFPMLGLRTLLIAYGIDRVVGSFRRDPPAPSQPV